MNLFHKLKPSVEKYPNRPALVIDGRVHTYQELYDRALQMGKLLVKQESRRVGVLASKTLAAYSGLLGGMASGKTIVPLLDEYPIARNLILIKRIEIDTLILDRDGLEEVLDMINDLPTDTVMVFPEMTKDDIPIAVKEKFFYCTSEDLRDPLPEVVEVSADNILYIIFTSGSTGPSKGVPITHKNLIGCFDDTKDVFRIKSSYKVAHSLDLTFVLAQDEFMKPWAIGATVYLLTNKELHYQVNFIQKNKINFWLMSPSNAQSLIRFGLLKENSLPDLQRTYFGGEPLSKSFIPEWRKAAPNSEITNGFGSTEAQGTACYHLPKQTDQILAHNGIVSVGYLHPSLTFCLVNGQDEKVEHQGELCLTGPGVFSGYLDNAKKNAEAFLTFDDDGHSWFKTGDIMKYENGHLFHLGRKDFMVKIRGARVDLEEISFFIKEFAKAKTVYTIAHPIIDGIANYLYVFMDKEGETDKAVIFKHLKEKLPFYMLPRAIFLMDDFPKNYHGKIDRHQLIEKIEKSESA